MARYKRKVVRSELEEATLVVVSGYTGEVSVVESLKIELRLESTILAYGVTQWGT